MRSAIAAVVLSGFIRKPRFNWSFAQVGGAVCFAVTVILFVTSTKLTTAANAILLQYTAPIYTALFSGVFLKERVHWYDWLVTMVVFGGILLFFMDNLTLRGTWGSVLAIFSGISWAWLGLFLRKQKDASPFESILLGHLLTSVIGLPFMFHSAPSSAGWLGLVLLGIFQMGISHFIYALAIRRVRALDAILVLTIEPIFNPIIVYILIGESPGRMAIVGGCVVLSAVMVRSILQVRKKRKRREG